MKQLGLKHFKNIKARDDYLAEYISGTTRSWEMETTPDRLRWIENEDLFAGKMDWGAERESEEWMSTPFIHEYAPVIRHAAVSMHNMLMNQPSFFDLEPGHVADPFFVSILDRLIKHEVERIGFAKKFGEYLLSGGIYGFATWKLVVTPQTVWKNRIILDRVEDEREKANKRASNLIDVGSPSSLLPDSSEELDESIENVLDQIFGDSAPSKFKQPELKETKEMRFQPELKLVNPFNLFWLPDVEDINDSPIVVERFYKKFFELHALFESGALDKRKQKEVLGGANKGADISSASVGGDYDSQKLRQRTQFNDKKSQFPTIQLQEYFGPIISKEGYVIEENAHIIVANNQTILKADRNEYFKGKPPYFTSIFSKRPFKAIGAGIGDGMVDQQKVLNHLFASFLDILNLDAYSAKAVNIDHLADPDQLDEGIKPLDIIETTGDSKAGDIISNLPTNSNIAPQVFQAMETLKLSGQKGSGVNTMTSNPSSRARISAEEVRTNAGKSNESLNVLAFELDENCIKPLVERVYSHILQFGLEKTQLKNYEIEGLLNSEEVLHLSNMSREDRLNEMSRKLRLNIRGFRASIEKQQMLRSYNELLFTLQNNPAAQNNVDFGYAIKEGVELYGFDSDKWIISNSPQDKADEENKFLLRGQFVATLPDDQNSMELPIHYAALSGQTSEMLLRHIITHISQAQQKGEEFPPPPPEIATMLGMNPDRESSMDEQKIRRITQ